MAGYGTSLYRLKIDDLGVGMEETAAHPSAHMELYPNPAANGEVVTIPVSIATQGYAQVSLTDLSGREVASIFKGSLASGKTNLQWTPENLPAGYYLCLLRWNGETVTQKLVIK
ncbi:MAG: hypothetical protein CSA04_05865 [Bacteroidetes bacterium]|nr:MAG: hypothetical protein CSA04_05865 [Bacteroidota bacterium]